MSDRHDNLIDDEIDLADLDRRRKLNKVDSYENYLKTLSVGDRAYLARLERLERARNITKSIKVREIAKEMGVRKPKNIDSLPNTKLGIKLYLAKQPKVKKSEYAYLKRDIREFQKSEDEMIIFTLQNPTSNDELRVILETLKIRPGYNTYFSKDHRYWTITKDTITKYLNALNVVEVADAKTSDEEAVLEFAIDNEIRIHQVNKEKLRKERMKRKLAKLGVRDTMERKGGGFFKHLNTTSVDLTRYGIYSEVKAEDYKLNCLQLAVKNSGLFTNTKVKELGLTITDRHIPLCKLKEVADILRHTIRLTMNNETRKYGNYGDILNLGFIDEHYFINEETKYTLYSVKNYEELHELPNYHLISKVNNGRYIRAKAKRITSYKLITQLMDKFKPITLSAKNILKTQYYADVNQSLDTLDYSKESVRELTKRTNDKVNKVIYYADFESVTNTKTHIAYMCCVTNGPDTKTYYGEDSGSALLEYLPDKSICYFHNLGYDFSFIIKYLNVTSIIKTGTMIKVVSGTFKSKKITFKDSYAMIAEPLSKFQKIFSIKAKKELMPYDLYTLENIQKLEVPIEEAYVNIDLEDLDEFKKLSEPYTSNGYFRLIDYAEFYCIQDCRTLMEGFEKFCEWIKLAFKLDVTDFVSLPSLADQYLYNEGVYDGVYELSGIPRTFIQQCVTGGRCMTRNNEKHHIKHTLNDFDAVSLYPSAMHRMGFLKGKPKVIDNLTMEFLNTCDGYFIEITNVKLNKHLAFPLQSEVIDNVRQFTNVFTQNIYVDKVGLEDLIRYQDATFDIVRGYYFVDGRNETIKEVIEFCFNERVKQKVNKNPIEVVYKLLMNASYGKTIQKPIETEQKFTNTKNKHDSFLLHNFNYIKSFAEIAKDKYVYDLQKSINLHFSRPHVGVEILSMSKRIMNEVMCLAEDKSINIWYQDTDSMHIDDNQIELLSVEFRKLYGRELIGKSMGQFHSDFINESKSIESYFLGKKSYIDELLDGDNKQTYHIRMKGIPNASILDYSEKLPQKKHCAPEYKKLNPLEIYDKLYNGRPCEFDLLVGRPKFKRNRDYSTCTLTKFMRKVQF